MVQTGFMKGANRVQVGWMDEGVGCGDLAPYLNLS